MASLCALGRVIDHAPSEEEYEIVGDAVSNADRYYKLVSTSVSQRQEEADLMSSAFKITAAAWVAQRTVSLLHAHLSATRIPHLLAPRTPSCKAKVLLRFHIFFRRPIDCLHRRRTGEELL